MGSHRSTPRLSPLLARGGEETVRPDRPLLASNALVSGTTKPRQAAGFATLTYVACNTVSSVAIPKLRAGVSVPVIGVIEPGAHAAIAMTRNRHVGVIGTRATIRSGAYENALRALNVHVRVSSVACPLLVPLIEEG